MAISFVSGGTQQGTATNGGNVTLTPPTLSPGDVTYVWGGRVGGPTMVTSGYSQVGSDITSGTHVARLFRKVQGSTPDTSIVIAGSGNAADAMACMSLIFRGADAYAPEGASATATGNSTNPDAPSIVTTRADSCVGIFATSAVHDTAITAPTGYNNVITGSNTDTNPASVSRGWLQVATQGATENPPSWTGWASGTWCAMTLEVLEYQGFTANTAALELETLSASVAIDVSVSAATAALEITAHAATVREDVAVSAGVCPLSLATHAATVTIGSDVSVSAGVAAMTLATHQAIVEISGGVIESTQGDITTNRLLSAVAHRTRVEARRNNAYISQNRSRAHQARHELGRSWRGRR